VGSFEMCSERQSMRLTVEDNPETIRRYAHLRPVRSRACSAQCPGSRRTCTRGAGHRGPHASHGRLGRVVAVWADDATADVPRKVPATGRRARGRVRRARRPIGLRDPAPTGLLAGLRNVVTTVASSMEELVWLVFAVAFTVLAVGGFVLITSG
jgi:hypothetical protein